MADLPLCIVQIDADFVAATISKKIEKSVNVMRITEKKWILMKCNNAKKCKFVTLFMHTV